MKKNPKKLFLSLSVSLVVLLAAAPVLSDCSDIKIKCWGVSSDTGKRDLVCGAVTVPTWYETWGMSCDPCPGTSLDHPRRIRNLCNNTYPKCCKGNCYFYWKDWSGGSNCAFRGGTSWMPPY